MSDNIQKLDRALRAVDASIVGVAIIPPKPKGEWGNSSWHATDSGVNVRIDWDHTPTRQELLKVDPSVSDENLLDDKPVMERETAKEMLSDTSPTARAIRALIDVIADELPTANRQKLIRKFTQIIDEQD